MIRIQWRIILMNFRDVILMIDLEEEDLWVTVGWRFILFWEMIWKLTWVFAFLEFLLTKLKIIKVWKVFTVDQFTEWLSLNKAQWFPNYAPWNNINSKKSPKSVKRRSLHGSKMIPLRNSFEEMVPQSNHFRGLRFLDQRNFEKH